MKSVSSQVFQEAIGKTALYRAKALECRLTSFTRIAEWWFAHAWELLALHQIYQIVGLIHPSSAAQERVFSLVSHFFGKRQLSGSENLLEASLLLAWGGDSIKCLDHFDQSDEFVDDDDALEFEYASDNESYYLQ